MIAQALAGAFGCGVNELPLSLVVGTVLVLPVVSVLSGLIAPFTGTATTEATTVGSALATVPVSLWADMAALPAGAALIGFLTAQGTVRRWLRRLP